MLHPRVMYLHEKCAKTFMQELKSGVTKQQPESNKSRATRKAPRSAARSRQQAELRAHPASDDRTAKKAKTALGTVGLPEAGAAVENLDRGATDYDGYL